MLGLQLPREPPLTPSADEAQEWALTELQKAIYNQDPTWLDKLDQWIQQLWYDILNEGSGLGPVVGPLAILAIVAVLVGLAFVVGGPLRRRRLQSPRSLEVLDGDDDRSAAAIRTAADAAAAAGDFHTAVLEQFRAIVRALDERAVLQDRLGRTALEAATAAGARLPAHAQDLLRASSLFDAVCYGSTQANAGDHNWLIELDHQVGAAKPTRTGDLHTAELVLPR
ncbi:MAG: DUF4129 domain-containing protein [Beutenbergiaceae bacterium]